MPAFRVGAAAGLRPLPAWKRAADFLFVQVSYSVDALLRWRDAHPVERDRAAGVEAACDQVLQLRDTGAFAGVHLVPVSRYRQVAARLEDLL
ncbi:putative methylenetetrahydrofolate reductase [Parafrankia sp. EAN1pec]|nr:putative methylenetetrahydrofolate reductase [Frankia sp. EAN1pec]